MPKNSRELGRWRSLVLSALLKEFMLPARPIAPKGKFVLCGGCQQHYHMYQYIDMRRHPQTCELRRMRNWAREISQWLPDQRTLTWRNNDAVLTMRPHDRLVDIR